MPFLSGHELFRSHLHTRARATASNSMYCDSFCLLPKLFSRAESGKTRNDHDKWYKPHLVEVTKFIEEVSREKRREGERIPYYCMNKFELRTTLQEEFREAAIGLDSYPTEISYEKRFRSGSKNLGNWCYLVSNRPDGGDQAVQCS